MKKMTKWLAVCAVCVMGSVPAMADILYVRFSSTQRPVRDRKIQIFSSMNLFPCLAGNRHLPDTGNAEKYCG